MTPTPASRSVPMTENRRATSASAQRRRRLVHHDDPRVGADRLRDFDELLFGKAQRLRAARRIDRRAGARQQVDGLALPRPPVDAAPEAPGLERERDVLGDGEIREERRLLVDRRDAQRSRCDRVHARLRGPETISVPASGVSAPVMIRMSVDLPAPFSPTSACTSPARRSKETPVSAWTPANDFVIERLEQQRRHGVRRTRTRPARAARRVPG